jgi:hypothetical protein
VRSEARGVSRGRASAIDGCELVCRRVAHARCGRRASVSKPRRPSLAQDERRAFQPRGSRVRHRGWSGRVVIRAARFPSSRTEAGYAATYCTGACPDGQSGLRADSQPARRTDDLVAGRRRACAAPARGCRPLAAGGRRRPRAAVASRTGGCACRHGRGRRSRRARWPQRRWPAAAGDRRRSGRRRGRARLRRLVRTTRQRQSAVGAGGPHEPAAGAGNRWRAAAVVELVRRGRDARAPAPAPISCSAASPTRTAPPRPATKAGRWRR